MAAYVSREKGTDGRGIVKHELTADGKVIREDVTVAEVEQLMRQIMKPGDTLRETYPDGSGTSAVPYEDMLKDWQESDAPARGEL